METAQQIFDTVVHHLARMPRQSIREQGDGCAYRGKEGGMCAVGCLIRDDEYDPKMDATASVNVCKLVSLGLLPERLKPFVPLLIELQCVHDRSVVWDKHKRRMVVELCEVARKFSLNTDTIQYADWVDTER